MNSVIPRWLRLFPWLNSTILLLLPTHLKNVKLFLGHLRPKKKKKINWKNNKKINKFKQDLPLAWGCKAFANMTDLVPGQIRRGTISIDQQIKVSQCWWSKCLRMRFPWQRGLQRPCSGKTAKSIELWNLLRLRTATNAASTDTDVPNIPGLFCNR